jgi:hypothetical protein
MQNQPTETTAGDETLHAGMPGVVVPIDSLIRARETLEQRALRCVSSGYLADECSCTSSISAAVVEAAWLRERERTGVAGNRLFHFAWRKEVWLAFGAADGQIRGVYCPLHRAERDARAAGCEVHDVALPARAAVSL